MSAVRIGNEAEVVFGVTDETWGFVQNLQKKTLVDEVELKDGDQDVRVVEQVNKRIEISGEYIYRSTGGPDGSNVGTGTPITIGGVQYYIKEATETDSSGEFRKISFSGTHWPSLSTEDSSSSSGI